MDVIRCRLRAFGRVALLAMAAIALLPTISRAWAASQSPAAQLQVCTAQGVRWMQPDAGGPGERAPSTSAEPCPYCILSAAAFAPPSALSPLPWVAALAPDAPAVRPSAPRTLPAWPTAQPRAPPQA
jgi:hypothetical protein